LLVTLCVVSGCDVCVCDCGYQELGTGSYSVCRRCVHRATGREYAVKVRLAAVHSYTAPQCTHVLHRSALTYCAAVHSHTAPQCTHILHRSALTYCTAVHSRTAPQCTHVLHHSGCGSLHWLGIAHNIAFDELSW